MHHGAMEVHVESILHNYRCIINGEYNYISLPSEWLYIQINNYNAWPP